MAKRPTMVDIALLASVSQATVSLDCSKSEAAFVARV
jgi:DNA-binding LacI/PurR family transcriptional regulator